MSLYIAPAEQTGEEKEGATVKRGNNNGPRTNMDRTGYQPWFRTRRDKNRVRDKMAKASRRRNRPR